jgi:hypothetical protein
MAALHFAALLLGLSGAATATCPSEPRTAAGALATEQRWVTALEQRDQGALECILDPTFADTNWRGELVPKVQVMKALEGRHASNLELSDVKPVLIGNVAIVRGINRQKEGTKVVGSVRFVDVFVYRLRRWQAVSAQESLISSP